MTMNPMIILICTPKTGETTNQVLIMNLSIQGLRPLSFLPDSRASKVWGQNLVWDQGHSVQVRAPSGRGKSTFAMALVGLRKDWNGSILWNGTALNEVGFTEARSSWLAYVPQNLGVFESLTVEKNLQLRLSHQGQNWTAFENDDFWRRACDFSGLSSHWTKPAGQLSQGERQRVSLLRALMFPFSWLIMDEPFSHLDEERAKGFWSLCQERVQQWGAGLVITSLNGESFIHAQEVEVIDL